MRVVIRLISHHMNKSNQIKYFIQYFNANLTIQPCKRPSYNDNIITIIIISYTLFRIVSYTDYLGS